MGGRRRLKKLGGDMEKMKAKGIVTVALILIVALLASTTLMSAVSTQATSQNVSDIGAKEKEVASQIPEIENFSKNVEAAEKIRKEIDREMEKEIDISVNNSLQKELMRGSVVYLGTDATFCDADEGDKGTSTSGVCQRLYGSEYYLNAKKMKLPFLLVLLDMEGQVHGLGLEKVSTCQDLVVKQQTLE
jgi:hypothetical protein